VVRRLWTVGQSGLLFPNGPAAPLPDELPPEPPLESPGSRVEPGLVFPSGPAAPPDVLPAVPPSWELSGAVFGCAPAGGVRHPELPETEQPLPSGSTAGGVVVEA